LKEEHSANGVEFVHGVPVHRLRGNLLPLVDLSAELQLRDEARSGFAHDGTVNIVVLQALDRQFGLVVDEISDTEEIVVKPLGHQLKQVGVFAGATIMGDGRVALIIDVTGVAQRAGAVSEVRDRETNGAASTSDAGGAERESVLVVGVGAERRMAIPLSAVSRLEEFDPSDVEHAGDVEVVQYRDSILPLVRVADVTGRTAAAEGSSERLQVVVHDNGRRSVGLVVDRILDIVEEHIVRHEGRTAKGILGSAVIQGRVTDIIDVAGMVDTVAGPPELVSEVA
jgi:two-component system chemotaxis sensor kinase CheA